MSNTAYEIICAAIEDINETAENGVVLSNAPETLLLDSNSVIDSLTLVRLLLAIEQNVEDAKGVSITIVDESAFEASESPFRTVATLTKHVESLLG